MSYDRADEAFRASPLFQELEQIVESGDYSAFDSQAKRQHFVPRFLLANFAVTSKGKEWIYQLDARERGAPRRVETHLAASRRHFYGILEEDGDRNTRVEGFLALVESHAATALRTFLDDPLALSAPDRATLSFFFGLQAQRTPHGINQMTQLGEAGMQMMMRTRLSDAKGFAESYANVFGSAASEEIEDLRLYMIDLLESGSLGLTEESAKAQALGNVLRVGAALGALIFDMEWELLLHADGFITSERGLAIHDPEPPYPWTTQTVFSSPHSETTIPLASGACLRLHPGEHTLSVQDADRATVDEINLRMYGWADGYIFGRSQQVLAELRRLARQRPQSIVRRRPHHNVVVFERDAEDDSVAEAHRRRGEPPYFMHGGEPHDYIVIKEGENAAQAVAFTNDKVRERAAKAIGLPPDATPPGAPTIDFTPPGDG